jgi:hypothetical protein
MLPDLRYPIGKYEPKTFSKELKQEWLAEIKHLPQHIESAILNLDKAQLETAYRPDGWTLNQVVHHVADSHINAYCRFKLGLTEDNPVIKTYHEKLWAETDDVKELPVNISITLLHALHARWYATLQNLSDEDWQRTVFHPEQKKEITLWFLLGMYAWHSKHHVAHILSLRERMEW